MPPQRSRDIAASPVHARNDKHSAFHFPSGPLPGVDHFAAREVAIPVGWWLDRHGGRALMIVLKSIFGKRISLRAERLTYVVGFVFLFAFLIWVTGFDLLRILGGGT